MWLGRLIYFALFKAFTASQTLSRTIGQYHYSDSPGMFRVILLGLFEHIVVGCSGAVAKHQ